MIDSMGTKWIGTNGSGLVKYDGIHWTVYTSSNSDFPQDAQGVVLSLAIDYLGLLWIGTEGGIAKFDGTTWTNYSRLSRNGETALLAGDSGTIKEIKNNKQLPGEYFLSQNYPNPCNPSTTIQYGLAARSTVRLVIYNIRGQLVSELVNTEQQAGYQSIVWNANVSSGLYFYKLEAVSARDPNKRFIETKKILLLR